MTTEAQNTVDVLRSISDHLSARKECRGLTYTVYIHTYNSSNSYMRKLGQTICESSIVFDTPILVFPDRHTRKLSDRQPVIRHIMFDHFPDISKGMSYGNYVWVEPCNLVPGVYQYIPSANGKKRKWTRIR